MAEKTIPWNDGSGDTIRIIYSGAAGNENIELSGTPNIYLDRSSEITLTTLTGNAAQTLAVSQPGLREEFTTSDGWRPNDGIYAVLKKKG